MQHADLSSVDMQRRTRRKATGRGGRGRSAERMEACVLAKKPSRPPEGSRLGWKLWIPRGPVGAGLLATPPFTASALGPGGSLRGFDWNSERDTSGYPRFRCGGAMEGEGAQGKSGTVTWKVVC